MIDLLTHVAPFVEILRENIEAFPPKLCTPKVEKRKNRFHIIFPLTDRSETQWRVYLRRITDFWFVGHYSRPLRGKEFVSIHLQFSWTCYR